MHMITFILMISIKFIWKKTITAYLLFVNRLNFFPFFFVRLINKLTLLHMHNLNFAQY